jgi:predicted DNA-binding transcriptional regulator YafY
MAINKNALIRFHALDKCFSNFSNKFYLEDLLEKCNEALYELNPDGDGIKKRQLFEDIKFMESSQGWSVPLDRIKEGRKVYYRYETSDFSINKQPMNELEAEKLKSALLVLSRFKGMPQFEWVNELILKLQEAFKLQSHEREIISFDANEYLKNIHFLGDLFNAILYKKVLKVDYQSFKSVVMTTLEIHPCYLKQHNNRWFLIGNNPEFENLTNLALDRIISFNEIDKKYQVSSIDFNEYFDDVIGVSIPPESIVSKITLQATPNLAPYIMTKPLHGSQKKISNDNNGFTFSIEVIPNHELEKLILSFGEGLKVMEPDFYKNIIKQRLLNSLANY